MTELWREGTPWQSSIVDDPYKIVEAGQLWKITGELGYPIWDRDPESPTFDTIKHWIPQGAIVMIVDWNVLDKDELLNDNDPYRFVWLEANILFEEQIHFVKVLSDSWKASFKKVEP